MERAPASRWTQALHRCGPWLRGHDCRIHCCASALKLLMSGQPGAWREPISRVTQADQRCGPWLRGQLSSTQVFSSRGREDSASAGVCAAGFVNRAKKAKVQSRYESFIAIFFPISVLLRPCALSPRAAITIHVAAWNRDQRSSVYDIGNRAARCSNPLQSEHERISPSMITAPRPSTVFSMSNHICEG
jgi:hypothetical protein